MKLLNFLDLYPEKISLVHKGEQNIRNSFSRLVSILVLCGIIVTVCILGQNFYKRKNPQILFKNSPTDEYPFFSLNYTNFFIGAALGDFSRNVIPPNDTSYKIIFRYTEHLIKDGKDIWNVKDLESVLCRETQIHPLLLQLDKKQNVLKDFLCPKDLNVTIGGDVSQLREMSLNVLLSECIESSNQKACLP